MKKELPKLYQAASCEDKIYEKWEKSGFFNPDNLILPDNAASYTIILPPPNITAKLHIGHAAGLAIEDLLIRYKRMQGYRTLYLPGTDHAAIATQNVVEKKILKEEGKTRHDLGREKFLEEVWSFLRLTQSEILKQIKKMGASLDWSRLAFTLDEKRQKAVRQMFVDMYHEGVIYQGERLVNWCPRCHSTLADDELDYVEKKTKLYWLKYGPFVLATTRPETKLGDTAVAVHPDDKRYKKYIGQDLEIEGVLGKFMVRVVADRAVDMNFGSGVIKVTPAHSFTDDEIAKRHNLKSKKIIDEDGKMMANCGKYAGLSTKQAREQIVADMESMGLIDHIDENYINNTSHCYRCSSVIEPLPSKQWFIAVDKKIARLGNKSLKERAIEASKNKEIEFIPERFTKRYLDWMENLHDWCISRQIWFGHPIPVWYRGEEIYCGINDPQGEGWSADPDTLDTWFSSGMWTFSTLNWPDSFQDGKKSGDLAKFHPSSVMETGYEIITLWVSRMVMMSYFAVGEKPFSTVYLHGMILDKDGKKMSKSKGNGIDPLKMSQKYGSDAIRLALLMGSTPGNDVRFSEEKIEAKRNFINKLWNIARFIIDYSGNSLQKQNDISQLNIKSEADKWIIKALLETASSVDTNLNEHNFSLAADSLTDFTWNKLADWYLEIAKIETGKEDILAYILKTILKLWHPFAPFVTETIWENFNQDLLMVAHWPQLNKTNLDNLEDNQFSLITNIITSIRNARSENKIEPAKKLDALIFSPHNNKVIQDNQDLIKGLKTGIKSLNFILQAEKRENSVVVIVEDIEIILLDALDSEAEKKRLEKEQTLLIKLSNILENKLANKQFIANAPKNIVAGEELKLKKYQQDLEKIDKLLKNI